MSPFWGWVGRFLLCLILEPLSSSLVMHFSTYLAALAASSSVLVSAAPPNDALIKFDPELRLIKTSESDPGVWVTEDEKMTNYVSKNINFVDITDIKVSTPIAKKSNQY